MTSRSCFSIGEYYDRNRASFYAALQGVRDAGMDLTGWFEYFVEGLSTQLLEVRSKGEMAIRRDALALQHGLSERQAKLVGLAVETGDMTIADILRAHPYLKRRTVQRDLKQLVDMGLFVAKGSTNNLSYRLQS
jgi:Fic family protein